MKTNSDPLEVHGGHDASLPAAAVSLCAAPFAGEARELGGHRPIVLDEASVWYVERGEVDLFSVALSDGAAVGSRSHFLRLAAGALFLGIGSTGRGLVAVGTSGARVVQAPRAVLGELLAGVATADRARDLVEGWIETLCRAVGRKRLGRTAVPGRLELAAGPDVEINAPTVTRSKKGVVWIGPLKGQALLFARPELPLEGLAPFSPDVWLEVSAPARLSVQSTGELPSTATLWQGLDTLHAMVRTHRDLLAGEEERANVEQTNSRSLANQATLEDACSRLAAALEAGGRPAPVAASVQPRQGMSALVAACRLVGEALDLTIKAPTSADQAKADRDPLALILRTSRLRSRKVALRGDWWRGDQGPLLGSVAEGGRPVALIHGRRGYLLHDPGSSLGPQPLDAALAASLTPFAFTIYRPFADTSLTVGSLLRFGLRGSRRDLLMVGAMGAVVALLGMFPAFATGLLFNEVIPGAHRSQLIQMSILLVTCALANAGFGLARGLATLRIQQRMGTAIQAGVWDRLMQLPLAFFRPYTAGDMAVRAMAIDGIQQTLSATTLTAIMGGVFSLGNLGMMFYYSPPMAWRALLLLGVAVVVTVVLGLAQLGPQGKLSHLQSRTSGLVLQLLTSVGKLRVAGAEPRAFAQWVERFAAQRRLQIQVRRLSNWLGAFVASFPVLAYVLIFWAALPLIGEKATVRTGDFLAFGSSFGSCLNALLGTCSALVAALSTVSLFEQAQPILEAVPEVHAGRSDPGVLSGEIEIQHAVFRYNSEGPPALRDVSLQIRPGEFVAFAGPSGSGKSTILKLLLGFETLESGSIHFDGQEIGGLDIQEVRRQMGVVLQNGRLVPGDILTNIVASGNANLDEAWEAARLAGIADDIQAMPMKMHTVISEGAGTLSGGQRQRLMIARAIVNRPRILLFDEATSALDNRTQAIVSSSLERLKATRIVVAHRLSTIANADRIYVVERGRIVQSGNYAALMKEKGLFSELARRQLV